MASSGGRGIFDAVAAEKKLQELLAASGVVSASSAIKADRSPALGRARARRVIAQLDKDGDGQIDRDEFVALMKKGFAAADLSDKPRNMTPTGERALERAKLAKRSPSGNLIPPQAAREQAERGAAAEAAAAATQAAAAAEEPTPPVASRGSR